MTLIPETTADGERSVPDFLRAELERVLLSPDWEGSAEAIEEFESRIDVLMIAALEGEAARSELLGACEVAGLAVERIRDPLKSVDIDELLYALSSMLADWRLIYVDVEKLVGHLVLDHAVKDDLSAARFKELLTAHTEAHRPKS